MSMSATLDDLIHSNSISAGPLPPEQNFTYLKQQAINILQDLAGHVWSNYNDSDPGVTILEQVIYALTELGYVNSFSIEDVLTRPNDHIQYEDQFFRPQVILTTAPVTVDDYRRLAYDHFSEVDNLYITPQTITLAPSQSKVDQAQVETLAEDLDDGPLNGFYEVDIYSKRLMTQRQEKQKDALANVVQHFLNSQRNLGEFFLKPRVLTEQKISLTGQALLSADADLNQIYKDIDTALGNYVSPLITQYGYSQARKAGIDTDDIFNGPELTEGWIAGDQSFGEKRSTVLLIDIITLLSAIDGVLALENVAIEADPTDPNNSNTANSNYITIEDGNVAHISLSEQFSLVKSSVNHNKSKFQQQISELSLLKSQLSASSIDSSIDIAPALPTGNFRQIEDYYSVQNTFPEIYGVGINALQSDEPDYRVAQVRQLQGYLMLFDQVIANQLSQLANLNNLFSFNFRHVASNDYQYHAQLKLEAKTLLGLATPEIPMLPMTRTYFCQDMYDIPGADALLKGTRLFQYYFPDDPTDAKQRQLLVWSRFKEDAFNQYFYGLNTALETTAEAEQRRDEILSHLLARHGESSDLYNDIIDASQWYGSVYRTRILVKTRWLQNLKTFSYRRNQAIDFGNAEAISKPSQFDLDDKEFEVLQVSQLQYGNSILFLDGSFDPKELDKTSKIPRTIYRSHATFTLKANMLLGFTQHLFSLALALLKLLKTNAFETWLEKVQADGASDQASYYPEHPLSTGVNNAAQQDDTQDRNDNDHKDTSETQDSEKQDSDTIPPDTKAQFSPSTANSTACLIIKIAKQDVLNIPADSTLTKDVLQSYVDQLIWLVEQQGWLLLEHGLLQPGIVQTTPGEWQPAKNDDLLLRASMILPNYVLLTQQSQFAYFVRAIQQIHWPSHIRLVLKNGDFDQLQSLIDTYCDWYQQMQLFSLNGRGNPIPDCETDTDTASGTRTQSNNDSDAGTHSDDPPPFDTTQLLADQTTLKNLIKELPELGKTTRASIKTDTKDSAASAPTSTQASTSASASASAAASTPASTSAKRKNALTFLEDEAQKLASDAEKAFDDLKDIASRDKKSSNKDSDSASKGNQGDDHDQ